MDIHRCRFIPYPPSEINALAFSHSHISKDQKAARPRLAVGRANGDIEIWNPLKGIWLQETIIRGGKDRSVDGLLWIQDPNEQIQGKTIIGKSRLFSIGYTTAVTEWDLEKGRPLRSASGNHGEIWCLAAQPALHPVDNEDEASTGQWRGQNLITGCTDGALVLYSTKDDGLELQKVLVRPSSKKAKIVSVAFQDRNIIGAGCSDSTIRVYDIRSGQMLRNMTLGSGPKGGPKEIIVWSVKVLKNGNIVSGDSTGELKIWDGKTYTLMQRIKSHRQDVLSLATSNDGSTIFSGGMDRRTVIYKPSGKGKARWEEVAHRRFHNHDVKTMASFEGQGMSVVVSGGPDASPTVVPLGQFGFENPRSLPFLPQELTIRSAPRRRLVMSWWDREVYIWRLTKPTNSINLEDEPAAQNRKLVAKILVKGESSINSAALNTEGTLLAIATSENIKMFHIRPESSEACTISKIEDPGSFSLGARLVQFSPDGKWLCVIRPDSHVFLTRITSGNSSTSPPALLHQISKLSRIDRKIDKTITLGGLGTYDRTITQTAFSSDSRILAISDLAGYVDTFILEGIEDLTQDPSNDDDDENASPSESDSEDEEPKPKVLFGQHWTLNPSASSLPKLPSTPVVLSFRPATNLRQKALTNGAVPHPTRNTPNPISHFLPTEEDRLLIVTGTSQIFEFEVLKGSLSPWSRRNPISSFPKAFTQIRDQARGAFWDISEARERVWLYGIGWLWMFDLARDLPPSEAIEESTNKGKNEHANKKRKLNSKRTTGAGSNIPNEKLDTGISRNMHLVTHEETSVISKHSLIPTTDAMDIDSDSADDEDALERLQRGEDVSVEGRDDKFTHFWHTFKYRPILGVCLLSEQDAPLEVAIVERPIWDVDLPPRYYGDQEWEKKDF